ncbi:hypothetical protein CYMTET_54479 [Cymbomonas tetramitiformis]|uniref:RING-type domain-containing protein n=1 Tax=Cymbomonas tetramitiformis TaxID=36881 RepID=A0AAE0BF56_9CHLO|nr:hypothetical protein CYMTET_54479 [Cymbomonas tetramitiformis]
MHVIDLTVEEVERRTLPHSPVDLTGDSEVIDLSCSDLTPPSSYGTCLGSAKRKHQSQSQQKQSTECPVCFEDFQDVAGICTTACGHRFCGGFVLSVIRLESCELAGSPTFFASLRLHP